MYAIGGGGGGGGEAYCMVFPLRKTNHESPMNRYTEIGTETLARHDQASFKEKCPSSRMEVPLKLCKQSLPEYNMQKQPFVEWECGAPSGTVPFVA